MSKMNLECMFCGYKHSASERWFNNHVCPECGLKVWAERVEEHRPG